MTWLRRSFPSPIGALTARWDAGGLKVLAFDLAPAEEPEESPAPWELGERLAAYFSGDLSALDPVPVAPEGPDFQRRVWAALQEIPPGRTCSYGELARRLGLGAGAARAVGAACGANPIGVIIPCHRVVGADGSLTGYAGGLHRKRWLLRHEGALHTRQADLFGQSSL